MESDMDLVESLIRKAGRRIEPPAAASRQVYAAASAALREKLSRRRGRIQLAWAAAAAVLALAVTLVLRWASPGVQQGELARVARAHGNVELAMGDAWRPLAAAQTRLAAGSRIRTLENGRAALELAGGESLRLAAGTEVMLDAPGRVYVRRGRIYVDSGERPGASRIEIVTPAGTARDLGTQFELQVAGAALRLRVREGRVAIDRGGRSITGSAGEQISIDGLDGEERGAIAPDAPEWQWAEAIAPTPDMDGRPVAALISWVARETGRRLRYESPVVEQRASTVILHGDIRNLPPLAALEAMLATTDLVYVLDGDTMEIHVRSVAPAGP